MVHLMAGEKYKVYIASYLFLKKDNKILLLRRYNTGWQDGNYTLVSGHIEEGENAVTTMKREAKEESNLDIDVKDLRVIHVVQRRSKDREYVDFYLTASRWKGEVKNTEPDKCDDLTWFESDNLPRNIIDSVRQAIKHIEKGEIYSTYVEVK